MPLVLKLFLHQDVQQVVENKTERIENRSDAFRPLNHDSSNVDISCAASSISAMFELVPRGSHRKKQRKEVKTKLPPRRSSDVAHHPQRARQTPR